MQHFNNEDQNRKCTLLGLRLQHLRTKINTKQRWAKAAPTAQAHPLAVLTQQVAMLLPMQQKNAPWLHKKRSKAAPAQQRQLQTTQQQTQQHLQQAPVAQQVLQQATPLRLVTAPAATAP